MYEVGFNHFFRGKEDPSGGDYVYFQGHASPGVYGRAFLEGRLNETNLINFRRELQPAAVFSSYPHPWLMPDFWSSQLSQWAWVRFVAIYHARFLRYLEHRGIKDTSKQKVWCFVGDGEVDEPETLGAIGLAVREKLDNLIFVVNCNLQRLDGPVRGNGKIIQELEGIFRGAGWNAIKVVWGSDWDPILAADQNGALRQQMMETVDGQYQTYSIAPGGDVREKFFGKTPELRALVDHLTDEKFANSSEVATILKRFMLLIIGSQHGGQTIGDPRQNREGYGLGDAGEGVSTSLTVRRNSRCNKCSSSATACDSAE